MIDPPSWSYQPPGLKHRHGEPGRLAEHKHEGGAEPHVHDATGAQLPPPPDAVHLLIWDGWEPEASPDMATVAVLRPGEVYVMDDTYYAAGVPTQGAVAALRSLWAEGERAPGTQSITLDGRPGPATPG